MNHDDSIFRWTDQLPRAFVALSGLCLFHLLSGDALVSLSMLALAGFAFLARFAGSIEKRITRIELSIVSLACFFVYIFGGYSQFYKHPSWPIVLSSIILLVAIQTLNESIPRLRLLVSPFLCLLFVGTNRYLDEGFESIFQQPLLSWFMLLLAWELLSSLIHSKRIHLTIADTGTSLAFVFIYYFKTAHFGVAAPLSIVIIGAFFYGKFRQTAATTTLSSDQRYFLSRRSVFALSRVRKSLANLSLITLILFAGISWVLFAQRDRLTFLKSLNAPRTELAIAQRDTLQAALDLAKPSPISPDSVRPRLMSLSGQPLFETIEDRNRSKPEGDPLPRKRKIIVRKGTDQNKPQSGYKGLNVSEDWRDESQRVRVGKAPAIRIRQQPAPSLLPSFTFKSELVSNSQDANENASRINGLDFAIGRTNEDAESEAPTNGRPFDDASTDTTHIGAYAQFDTRKDRLDGPADSLRSSSVQTSGIPRDIQAPVGFAETLEYAENVNVLLNTTPVLEIYLPDDAQRTRSLHLRFNTLDQLNSESFSRTLTDSRFEYAIDTAGWNTVPPVFQPDVDSDSDWTLVIGADWKDELPIPGRFHSIQIPSETKLIADEYQFALRRVSDTGAIAYRLKGVQLSDTRPLNFEMSQEDLSALTQLPLPKSEVVYLQKLASRIGGKNTSREKFAQSVGAYFKRNHPYQFSFKFNTGKDHILVRWLKTSSPGICGYYAGAFTLLARSRGIPARVVVGALTREYNPKTRAFTVRSRDAHAWAEFLNEENQWVRADLTPFATAGPRFEKSLRSQSNYATNLRRALQELEESAVIAKVDSNASDAVDGASNDALSNESDKAVVPSALEILDRIIAQDEIAAKATPLESPTAIEPSNPTEEIAIATIAAQTPPQPNSSAQPSSSEEIIEALDVVSISIEQEESDPSQSSASLWNVLKYLIGIGLITLAVLQIWRSKTSIALNHEARHKQQPFRQRMKAGRILAEIEQRLFDFRDQPPQPLLDIHRKATLLRYGPHYSRASFKALKQEFKAI